MTSEDHGWYSVRCIFSWGRDPDADLETYEERITVWRARSFEEAILLAEQEAERYAGDEWRYLGTAQAFAIDGGLGTGAEVFSLLRRHQLAPDAYLDRFFTTGTEREQPLDVESGPS